MCAGKLIYLRHAHTKDRSMAAYIQIWLIAAAVVTVFWHNLANIVKVLYVFSCQWVEILSHIIYIFKKTGSLFSAHLSRSKRSVNFRKKWDRFVRKTTHAQGEWLHKKIQQHVMSCCNSLLLKNDFKTSHLLMCSRASRSCHSIWILFAGGLFPNWTWEHSRTFLHS